MQHKHLLSGLIFGTSTWLILASTQPIIHADLISKPTISTINKYNQRHYHQLYIRIKTINNGQPLHVNAKSYWTAHVKDPNGILLYINEHPFAYQFILGSKFNTALGSNQLATPLLNHNLKEQNINAAVNALITSLNQNFPTGIKPNVKKPRHHDKPKTKPLKPHKKSHQQKYHKKHDAPKKQPHTKTEAIKHHPNINKPQPRPQQPPQQPNDKHKLLFTGVISFGVGLLTLIGIISLWLKHHRNKTLHLQAEARKQKQQNTEILNRHHQYSSKQNQHTNQDDYHPIVTLRGHGQNYHKPKS